MYSGVPMVMPDLRQVIASPSPAEPGQAEVGHLHLAGRGQHDVFRLDVAVDDAAAAAPCSAAATWRMTFTAAGRTVSGPCRVDHCWRFWPATYSWAMKWTPVDAAHLVDLHDVGVHQGGRRLASRWNRLTYVSSLAARLSGAP